MLLATTVGFEGDAVAVLVEPICEHPFKRRITTAVPQSALEGTKLANITYGPLSSFSILSVLNSIFATGCRISHEIIT